MAGFSVRLAVKVGVSVTVAVSAWVAEGIGVCSVGVSVGAAVGISRVEPAGLGVNAATSPGVRALQAVRLVARSQNDRYRIHLHACDIFLIVYKMATRVKRQERVFSDVFARLRANPSIMVYTSA